MKKVVTKKKIIKKEKKIGKIIHYFNKIKVGVIKLSDVLSVGDQIIVKSKTEEKFKQKVASIEIDGKKIKKAKKGQEIGLKLKDKTREDYLVYKL
jgi:putative protease